jgi:hypothetical protein
VDNNVSVNSGGTLRGTLTVGDLVVASGGVFSPGINIGTLVSDDTTWGDGGSYWWEIGDAAGAPGSGWDFADITGTLDIQATISDPFIIKLFGSPANFSVLGGHSFVVATAAGGISGFAPDIFAVDASSFGLATPAGATWRVSQLGNSIVVNYTATPEPSQIALWVVGGLLLGAPRLRRLYRARFGRAS